MNILRTEMPGVLLLKPHRHIDARGNFFESWNRRALEQNDINLDFVQENQSLSIKSGTVRGLHFQAPPFAQGKLIRCIRGELYDVAVDIRCGSPTYGKWFGAKLSAENAMQILIPKGFLHGYITRSSNTEILYKCTEFYVPDAEGCVSSIDPDIEIDWGIDMCDMTLSERDRKAQSFKDFKSPFVFSETSEGK